MAEIYDWDVDADNNDSSPPDGWPEDTMAPRDVNNIGREMMAVVARYQRAAEGCITTTGVANAYVITVNQTLSELQSGMRFAICPHITCVTGTATIVVNSLASVPIFGSDQSRLLAGELTLGLIYTISYTGSSGFAILNPTLLDADGLIPLIRIPSTLTGKNADLVDGLHISTSATGEDPNTLYFRE